MNPHQDEPKKSPPEHAGTSRRTFMRTGAAFGAGLSLGSAASYARIIGANERVRTGVIGVGNRGENLLLMTRDHCPDAELIAVCDVYEPYREISFDHIDRKGIAYRDYRDLLDNSDIDAVIVATPDHWHAKIMVDACRAGKDVYVEKPLSLTVAEGRVMSRVARETGRVTQMGAQRHSADYVIEACRLMREGAIGHVHRVRCFHLVNEYPMGIGKRVATEPPPGLDWDLWLGPAPKVPFEEVTWNYKFRWFWPYSGGQVTNMATHYLDVIQMALGQDAPRAVVAMGGHWVVEDDRDIPDTMEALWEYDRCLVSFSQINANDAPCGDPNVEIEFRGTTGTLYLYGNRFVIEPQEVQADRYVARGPLDRNSNRYRTVIESKEVPGRIDQAAHLGNFFECVKTRAKCNCDVETGHRSTTATLLVNIAYRLGRKLTWDRDAERFLHDAEADEQLSYQYREPWKLA